MLRSLALWMAIFFGITLLVALAPASAPPERPRYLRDVKTGLCYAEFGKETKEHLAVPCTPEVLKLAEDR